MTTYIFIMILFSAFITSLYYVAMKYGIIDWYELNRLDWMPEKCEFCLFFWLNLILWTFADQHYEFLQIQIFNPDLDKILFLFISALCGAVYSKYLMRS
jgi:hypothetical protein